jgi:hypothetical protein
LANTLGGSGDDPRNLVTLYQKGVNSPNMRDFELLVKQVVVQNQETVKYTVTPIYGSDTDLAPTGVRIQAEGSKGFSLDVVLTNAQDASNPRAQDLPDYNTYFPSGGKPQFLDVTPIAPGASIHDLSLAELQVVVSQAESDLQAAGYNVRSLGPVDFRIVHLPESLLGWTYQNTIWIDQNAQGYGWYTTVSSNSAFTQAVTGNELQAVQTSPAFGHADLLTVVTHELGHVLGLDSINPSILGHDWMTATLGLGVRRYSDQAPGRARDTAPAEFGSSIAYQASAQGGPGSSSSAVVSPWQAHGQPASPGIYGGLYNSIAELLFSQGRATVPTLSLPGTGGSSAPTGGAGAIGAKEHEFQLDGFATTIEHGWAGNRAIDETALVEAVFAELFELDLARTAGLDSNRKERDV